MKFLVIGLGSMGKRRVRNLQALGYKEIAGFDVQQSRLDEARKKYEITTFNDIGTALAKFNPTACVISTSPDKHMEYAFMALDKQLSCFIEASVIDAPKILELHNRIKHCTTVMAPSCTMRYFSGPKKIKELIAQKVIGKALNFNYQTGQYLPDWHPWEKIEDYYVSKSETGACREIVPFELTWLNDIFGNPEPLACVKAKLTDMNTDIDDIYHLLMRYPNGVLANITVEVISQPKATRDMRIIGTEGEIVFSADENSVRWINRSMSEWQHFNISEGTVEDQYINPEEPYIAEMQDFVNAVKEGDSDRFPNNLHDDYLVLQTLYRLEELSSGIQ